MKIIKDGSASGSVCTEQELQAINAFAKAQLTADEVYAFQVLLCDNEVDRDFERFSVSTLRELSELFVGATGICDHDWRSENQVARIYRTELVTEKGKTTSCGEAYVYLKGFAYMLRTEANTELIAQIEGGIKRETSVGCSVAQSICSICGAEIGTCSHEKGKAYGDKRCCKAVSEIITHRGEMRRFLLECISQKPTVADICADLIRCPPQGRQAVQMLDQNHFEQHNRVNTGPPVIFAIQWFHHFIEPVKIYCCIYFSQQMVFRHQTFCIYNLYDTTIHFPRSSIFHHPYLLYHLNTKKPSRCWTFSTD